MKEKYIELMEKALSAYSDEHILRYFNDVKEKGLTEHGFPRLTVNIGILISHGRRRDLLPIFLEMMEFCCKTIPHVKAANDFSVREIVCCLLEIEQSRTVSKEEIEQLKESGNECIMITGDSIYTASHVAEQLKIVGEENVFWNDKGYHSISEFYAKYLNYNRKFKLKDIDVLIYISGGYFCGADKHLKDYVFRYLRYFHIGILCMLRRKPYAIIAVEAAKSRNCVINYIQQILIRNAKVVVVRNQPSMDYVESILGKNCKAYCTTDSVFAMKRSFFENYQIPKEIEYSPFPKLFLHCNPNSDKNQKILEIL